MEKIMIEALHLKKSFHEKLVLEDVSFHIGKGETVGLYGPNGAGKSTITRLLCGLIAPDEGEILLHGKRLVSAHTPYDRWRGIVIQPVYQQPQLALDPAQKITEGFRELIRYHHMAANRREAEEIIREKLSAVGLARDIADHYPHQISGGEAQRICLARSLLFHPEMIILDEATSMLDVLTQSNVLGMIRRVMKEAGGAILFISHDRALVEHISDRVYLLQEHGMVQES